MIDIITGSNLSLNLLKYIPVIKKAWRDGQALSIHGFIYDIKDGHLHNLNVTIDNADDAEKAVSTK